MLLRPLGYGYWGVEQTEGGFTFLGKGGRRLVFSDLAGLPTKTKALGFQAASFPLKGGSEIKLVGLSGNEVALLISTAQSALRSYYAAIIDDSQDELQSLAKAFARLENPRRYPSACLLEPFLSRAATLMAKLPPGIPDDALSEDKKQSLDVCGVSAPLVFRLHCQVLGFRMVL